MRIKRTQTRFQPEHFGVPSNAPNKQTKTKKTLTNLLAPETWKICEPMIVCVCVFLWVVVIRMQSKCDPTQTLLVLTAPSVRTVLINADGDNGDTLIRADNRWRCEANNIASMRASHKRRRRRRRRAFECAYIIIRQAAYCDATHTRTHARTHAHVPRRVN